MLHHQYNPKTKTEEYCLVSKSSGKVLEWYGSKRPSDARVDKSEKRVQYFKNKK